MSSPVRKTLEAYLAGRSDADRVVAAVASAHYTGARESGEGWRRLVEVIERAAPGVVELARSDGGAGFQVKVAERPFPKGYEDELRRAVEVALSELPAVAPVPPAPTRAPGLMRRLFGAIQRLFSA